MGETEHALGERQDKALAVSASRPGRLFRRIVWRLLHAYYGHWHHARCIGAHHLDTPGPLIVAPVHRSNLDAPLVATRTERMVYALSKESLFDLAPAAWVISALGAFPVNRGAADRDALRAAEAMLARGQAVIVFPEGTRQEGDVVGEVFDGAAFLAARTGAAVVPVGVAGTEAAMPPGVRFPRRTPIAVVVGPPLRPSLGDSGRLSMKQRRAFTDDLRQALQAVFDEARMEAEQP